jgi:uncharacterized protein (TIGR00369 family)
MAMAMADELAGLRRGLGRDGQPIPAYQALGLAFRTAAAGAAVVRMPMSPHLTPPGGGLLPGAFAVVADACCGSAVATALSAGGAALTAQLRVEFIRPVPPGAVWIEGRAEADAVDEHGGLARGEIVDEADRLLGVASLRLMKASQRSFPGPAAGGNGGLLAAAPSAAPAAASAGDLASRFLGVVSREAGSGRSVWTLRPSAATANSYGMVHGGVLGLLAHQVATDAQRSLTGPDEQLVPLDLVVNFYRGVPASGGLLAATAQVTHRGRRFVVAEGEVTGPDGKPALRLSAGAQVRVGG